MALSVNGLSSMGNLMVSVTIARGESLARLGQFALAFSIYVLAVGLVRTAITESVLAGRMESAARTAVDGARRACIVAVGIGALAAVGGMLLGSPYLAIIGLALPGLVIYDYVKAISLGVGVTRVALAQEALWTGCVAAAVVTALWAPVAPVLVFASWAGAGASIGLAAALRQRYDVLPGWGLDRHQTHVAATFGAQFLVTNGAAQLALTGLASAAGMAVVGAVGAARTVFGPVALLVTTLSSLIVPYLARRRPTTTRARIRTAGPVVVLIFGLALPLVLAVCLLPDGLGRAVLGENWSAARPLLPLLAVEALLAPVALVAFAGHRVQAASTRALLIGGVLGPVRIAVIVVGGVLFGAGGAAGALAVLAVLSAGSWWLSYLSLDRGGDRGALDRRTGLSR
jgi:O-antigen/teichoic acid export membrane protein